jgi:hypothetical protein
MTAPEKRRHKDTIRKSVRLTPETAAAVDAWCRANQTSFSGGLETLVKVGLGEPVAQAMVPAVVNAVRRAILHQSNRLAKLWSFAAVESGTAPFGDADTARLAGVHNLREQLAMLVTHLQSGEEDD